MINWEINIDNAKNKIIKCFFVTYISFTLLMFNHRSYGLFYLFEAVFFYIWFIFLKAFSNS